MKGLAEEVREIMKEYIGDNSVAGVTVLAVQDGKEICDCQEGMADIENGRVMKRDTIFRLYSQTLTILPHTAITSLTLFLWHRMRADNTCLPPCVTVKRFQRLHRLSLSKRMIPLLSSTW